MSLASNLIKWTPKILKASADDIAEFGPQAARVRALLNFIPGISDDAAKISDAARRAAFNPSMRDAPSYAALDKAWDAGLDASRDAAWGASIIAAEDAVWDTTRSAAYDAARKASSTEVVSDLITPQVYRTMTNPMASARALDRLAGRAPESFVPIARNMGERGLVSAPADIVTALRVSKLPQEQQSLVMNLVDSGMTIEDAIAAARALS